MNKSTFYQYLRFPELLDDRSLPDIENLIKEFPYFQTAHLLQIKNLNNQGSLRYQNQLKRTAAWVTNRKKLFFLLDKRVLLPVNENFNEVYSKPIQDTFKEVVDFTELSEHTNFEFIGTTTKEIDELDQLIMSGAAQTGAFFNLEELKQSLDKNKKTDKQNSSSKRDNLIDSFIDKQPQIIPKQNDNQTSNIKSYNLEEKNEGMITDTLAKIYIKQGLYEKAINAYEKLSLKYPKKNIYFASQIKKIKQLISNQ